MNSCRLTRLLVNNPQRFSNVLYVGKHRAVTQTLYNNPDSVRSFYNGCRLLESFRTRLRKSLQRHGSAIWCACSNQAQYVAVHRVWRGQQTSVFHLKLWGGGAFTGLVVCLVSQIIRRGFIYMCRYIKSKSNRLLLSCSGAFVYDWKKNRIREEELTRYFDEIEAALCLKKRTFEINRPSVTSFCTCDDGKANHSQFERELQPWSTFLVLQHLYVWKREVPNHRGDGLFEYKVYGKYQDVTARDFMAANIDTMYRKMWDTRAVILEVLETDKASNSDVIYWEIAWPRMMNNRDYVYMRRYMVDESKKVVVIVNQNAAHPQVPPFPGKERISEYWSIIVIKPFTEMNKPGIEFTMTYFDNPGANVPASIMAWGSATAFPDFHKRLHQAAKEYASRKKNIAEFTKAEKEKGSSVKKGSERSEKDPGLPERRGLFGGGSSYLDFQFEQECREEEESERQKGKKGKSKSTDAAKKTSACVIRKKEDYIYKQFSWIAAS